MTDKLKTTIQPTRKVHDIAKALSDLSGMSYSGVYCLGALTLAARHARALEHAVKRKDLLKEIREAFEGEMRKVEEDMG